MENKNYLAVVIGLLIVLVGITAFGFLQTNFDSFANVNPGINPTSISAPYDKVTFQGTVVSVIAGDSIYEDRVVVRIDSIESYNRDEDASYERVDDSLVGEEVEFGLAYSARPAFVHCELLEAKTIGDGTGDGDISTPTEPRDSTPEDVQGTSPTSESYRYLFTYYSGSCPADIAMDGLIKNDRIEFEVAYNGDFSKIGIYDVLFTGQTTK